MQTLNWDTIVKSVPVWSSSRCSVFSLFLEDAPLRSFVASHIPRFFACPKKKKKREKMVTLRGFGRQKSWHKGAFSPNAIDVNTVTWDACIAPLDHFGLFASFALVVLDVQTLACSFLNCYFSTRSLSTSIMADITTVAALYLLCKSQKRLKTTRRRYLRLTGAHFEVLLARVGAHNKQRYVREVTSSAWTRHWLDDAARCRMKSLIFSTLFASLQTLQTLHSRRRNLNRVIYIDFQCRVAAQFASVAFGLNAP